MVWNNVLEVITKIFNYLTSDPLRILSLVGGSGGLVYWYDRYRNRTRLRVKLLDLGLSPHYGKQQLCIRFEAENLGTLPVSLEPLVLLSGIIPVVMRKKLGPRLQRNLYNYEIISQDRNLPPHAPKIFEAYGDVDDIRPFLWFIIYRFTPTRGKVRKIRIRSSDKFRLSCLRYVYELMLYAIAEKLIIK